jgi:hypothetical protein
VLLHQLDQAVVVGAARWAHGQMGRDAREADAPIGGLDVAVEHRAGEPAPRVARIDGEHPVDQVLG